MKGLDKFIFKDSTLGDCEFYIRPFNQLNLDMKKIVILDYEKVQVHSYSVKTSDIEGKPNKLTKVIEALGHDVDFCEYLIIDSDEQIINH